MKSQIITKEVKKALLQWYENESLNYRDIAKMIGVTNSTVAFWMGGTARTIRPRNWAALYPHLKKYLPVDFVCGGADAHPPDRLEGIEMSGMLSEFLVMWPKLSKSEQARVLTFTAELLEKQGGPLQPQILDKVN